MPPAPLPLLSCSWPCPPPPPQGRRPVCAEKGACALLLLHFPAPPPIRVPIPAFPAVRHSHPLLRSFIPPFFLLPLSFAPPPIRVPFSRVPRRATFPSAPLRQVLTGNKEKSRQPHRRSSRTKKSDPLGPDTIGYQSVFQKKGDYISRIRMLSPNIIKAVRTH